MASAASAVALTTAETTVFTGNCTTFRIHALTASVSPVLVSITGVHAAGEFARVNQGSTQDFRSGIGGITQVIVKGDAGNATVDYTIAARV